MNKAIMAALVLTASCAGLSVATAQDKPESKPDKVKVGFVYVGPVGDFGWSYQHDQARQAIVKEFGDKVETTYLEKVSEGPDGERSIEQLARAGNKLIFVTSFGYMDSVIKVAKKYPDVKFEHATGYKREPNVSTYAGRFYEGRTIQGTIAAKISKKGVLGYIGSFPVPEVISGINATMLAAQKINPNIKVKIVWVNSWFNPGKEADAAKTLIDQGADVIMQHTDSAAAVQIANERGIHAFGQDSDMIKFGPKAQLTAIINNWTPYYVSRVKAVMDGNWASQDVWEGLKDKMIQMAPYTNMPDDVKKLAADTEAGIAAGTIKPFACPILDQDGKEIECKGGDQLDDGQIRGMNFYVKGIDDKIPGK
ncbi:BMP family ABC transporter substrate-binding protein [Rhodopseudomonas palustris]|uniref:BMP family ABC transporter substrate-binding protein n=1 Tax=Rhodopseudomonas palustris TaxID=1076 RepID=UPI000D1A1FF7|nr:BMP family ABC transporter substrate-binding protein [Rhodopseudomonas palustris]AVT83445.1 BMP family ABC transporter substrate-binding protein [Rhodopseudomonas palustris]